MIDLKEQAGSAMNVGSQLGEAVSDPQVTLGALAFANELGSLLWRMKYGQDIKRSGLHRATLLLAIRIRWSGKFARGKFTGLDRQQSRDRRKGVAVERSQSDIVERFARRAIVEWVADLCPHCDGRGILGRSIRARVQVHDVECPCCAGMKVVMLDEQYVPFAHNGLVPFAFREFERCGVCLGRGKVRREEKPDSVGRQLCKHCDGTGRARVDEPARAHALGVSLDLYRNQWARQFETIMAMLDQVDGRADDTMRRQMQR